MTDETNLVAGSSKETATQIEIPAATSSNPNSTIETSKVETSAEKPDAGILNNKEEEQKSEVKPDWPEDWLDKLAGTDEKIKNQLGRYASPKAVADALIAAQKKISSYKPQVELPKDPKPEDITAYRKAYGIPEKATDYDIKLDNGIVIGEADRALVDKFLERAHARHAKPTEVKAALQDHFENLQIQNEEIMARMAEQRKVAEDELRAEWGGDFRKNTNIINNFLQNKFGGEVVPALMGAVLGDGTVLQDNPKVLRSLLAMANELDPIATLGGSSNTTASSIESELNSIQKVMRENPAQYFADKNMVKRFEELTIANERLNSRR